MNNTKTLSKRGEMCMALDIIKDIVEAEARAEEMIKLAEVEATSLKTQAEQKGEVILSDSKQKFKEELSMVAKQSIKESEEAVNDIRMKVQIDCDKIKESASLKKDEAIEAIIRRVVRYNGNS